MAGVRGDEQLAQWLARLEKEEVELKTAQPTSGLGIVGYRYSGEVQLKANTQSYLVFRRKYKKRPALVKMAESVETSLYPVGVISQDGVHLFPLPVPYFDRKLEYAIRSSQPGEVEFTDQPPF